jgi:hypothetical protein
MSHIVEIVREKDCLFVKILGFCITAAVCSNSSRRRQRRFRVTEKTVRNAKRFGG